MAKEKLTFIRGKQASNVAGTIWFDTDAKVIKVGDGNNWDIFDGKIKDASFVDGILTIEKYGEGVAPVVLNLSNLASAEAVANAFVEAHNKIKANAADIKSIQDELNSLSGGAGSIATQIDNAIKALDVEDTVVEGQYVSGVSETDGKITVTRAALPDYTEVYDAKGDAAKAEAAAKKYADDTFQVKGNYETAGTAASLIEGLDLPNTYEAKGAAEDALDAAKTYADSLVMADGVAKFDAAGTAKGFNDAMDERVKVLEAIDHKDLAAQASAAAVATVLDGAPEKFDTLKEVAQWIADSETAADAADLVTRVKALEDIDHDAYVAADETVLASAKSYADGLVMDGETPRFDAKGAAAQALVDAKAYVDPKFQAVDTKIGTVPEGKDVVTMISDAKTAAETAANGYTDGKIAEITAAETGILAQAKKYADDQDAANLATAKKYTDDALTALVGENGQVGKNTAAIAVLNGDDKTDGSVAKALADAKKYTDEVFMWAEF